MRARNYRFYGLPVPDDLQEMVTGYWAHLLDLEVFGFFHDRAGKPVTMEAAWIEYEGQKLEESAAQQHNTTTTKPRGRL